MFNQYQHRHLLHSHGIFHLLLSDPHQHPSTYHRYPRRLHLHSYPRPRHHHPHLHSSFGLFKPEGEPNGFVELSNTHIKEFSIRCHCDYFIYADSTICNNTNFCTRYVYLVRDMIKRINDQPKSDGNFSEILLPPQ